MEPDSVGLKRVLESALLAHSPVVWMLLSGHDIWSDKVVALESHGMAPWSPLTCSKCGSFLPYMDRSTCTTCDTGNRVPRSDTYALGNPTQICLPIPSRLYVEQAGEAESPLEKV